MARNTAAMKRGWNYDLVNGRLSAMVDGIEALRLTKSVTGADVRIFCDTPASNYVDYNADNGKLKVTAVWATASATGRPLEANLTVNATLGGWSNALKGYVAYGTSGLTAGLGSAVNAEILLSTGTTSGTYAPLESELVANSAVSTGTATSFLYCNIAGSDSTGKTTLNTNGYFFEIGAGIADTENGMFEAEVVSTVSATHVLRVRIDGTAYYIALNTAKTM